MGLKESEVVQQVRTPLTEADEEQLDQHWRAWVRFMEQSPQEQAARQTLAGTMRNLVPGEFGHAWDEKYSQDLRARRK